MRLRTHSFAILASLFTVATIHAGQIDPGLETLAISSKSDQPVLALILGKHRGLDPARIREILDANDVPLRNRRTVIQKEESRENLSRLLGDLETLASKGDIQPIEFLWNVNGIAVQARPAILVALAAHPDVDTIVMDRQVVSIGPRIEENAPLGAPRNWAIPKIKASQAWESTGRQGNGMYVGLIDTGVDGNHPDLKHKVSTFRDFTKITAPITQPYDDEGHGTHCAGSIVGGNSSGESIGVAPKATLITAKALSADGSGGMIALTRSLQWMADPDGDNGTDDQPIAVSGSWGANLDLPVVSRIFWLSVSSLRNAGVVPVFASGNEGPGKLSVPGSYPHSMAVGSTDEQDEVSYFTSRGTVSWGGTTYMKPDISAPGSNIYSCRAGGGYTSMSGTSMSTPHVAGAVALLASINRNLTAKQYEQALYDSAVDLGDSGRDAVYGYGRIDLLKAAQVVQSMAAQAGELPLFLLPPELANQRVPTVH